jgi:hypothetical protein
MRSASARDLPVLLNQGFAEKSELCRGYVPQGDKRTAEPRFETSRCDSIVPGRKENFTSE